MIYLKKSTAYNLEVLMVDSTDHITGKTGLTLTIAANKNGAAFASITPTVTELSYGWYNLALATAHTDTVGMLALHATATGADPMDVACQVFETTTDDLVRSTTPANTLDVSATGEAGLDFANIKSATGATTLTNITVPTVTSLTNDVGITQAGADKVWSSTARTLTSFGTLVADIWANATRTLSAFAFTVSTNSDSNVTAIKAKTDNLPVNPASQTNLDVAISTRLASASYTAPPSAEDIASAVWGATARTLSSFGTLVSDIWTNSTRSLSTFGFTVATNSDSNVSAIMAKTDNLPVNPASQTNLDVAISTRLASASYSAPPSTGDIASAVWGATTRTLTSFGSLVDDVWNSVTRTLTSSGTSGATAQEVWEYGTRELTDSSLANLDAPVSSAIAAVAALNGLQVTYLGPMIPGGNAEVICGDDYTLAEGRALSWNVSGLPDLTGATLNFVCGEIEKEAILAGNVISVELVAAETSILKGSKSFVVRADLENGHVITLISARIVGK